MAIKLLEVQAENFKRIKAVDIQFNTKGLTVIGGKNAQGKTSVLDSIMYTIGGKKYMPDNVKREDSMSNPYQKVVFDNGIVAERKGKNFDLYVTDTNGMKGGQTLLDTFVSSFALDIAKFMNGDDKVKAKTLLSIIGVEDQLNEFDAKEKSLEQDRLLTGRELKNKRGYLDQCRKWEDVPTEPIDTSALAEMQREALARNQNNDRLRSDLEYLMSTYQYNKKHREDLLAEIADIEQKMKDTYAKIEAQQEVVDKLVDTDISEITDQIESAADINSKIEDNKRYAEVEADMQKCADEYSAYDAQIAQLRADRIALLNGADMPLEGLTIENGKLLYKGQPWGNMSGAEQLIVATSIVRKINPECGFVLLDKLEQLDEDTLKEFNEWLESVDLQAIGTRVSTGAECTIIIEDGSVKEDETENAWSWKG